MSKTQLALNEWRISPDRNVSVGIILMYNTLDNQSGVDYREIHRVDLGDAPTESLAQKVSRTQLKAEQWIRSHRECRRLQESLNQAARRKIQQQADIMNDS